MTSSSKAILLLRLGLFAGILGALLWAWAKLDWGLVRHELGNADVSYEIAMAAAWILALFIRPLRMVVLIRTMAPEARRGYWPVWSADIVAMAMNSVIPMRAGDVMMAFSLRRSIGIRAARGTSVVVVDRFFDFATVLVIFVMTLAMAPTVIPWAQNITLSIVLALLLLAGGLWASIRFGGVWLELFERALSRALPQRVVQALRPAHDLVAGLALVDRLPIVGVVAALSVVQWAVITSSYWFGISAFLPGVSVAAAGFAACAVALSFIVPIAPGGFGVFHGAVVLALSLFGVPFEPALAFAIVAHAFQMGSVVVIGIVCFLWQGVSLRELANARDTNP